MASTILDIKKHTGLSLATISKYINGGHVRPENKIKLDLAIRELNYEANDIARGLVTKKTRTIGVVVYSIEDTFNGTLLHYIGVALRKEKYGMLICDSCLSEEIEAANIRFLVNKRVDGIIVIPISNKSDFLKPAFDLKIPVVLLDRPLRDLEINYVGIDNRLSAKTAVNQLIKFKHTKIAVICSDSKNEYTGYERYKGFIDALTEAKIPVNEQYIKSGRHSIEFGQKSMTELLRLKNRPTAVFLTNYNISLGAVIALNETNLKCPKDISMMGFDDLLVSHVIKPKLRVVIQPMEEMSEKAVEILLGNINNPDLRNPVDIRLPTAISDGDSISELK